MSWFEVLCEPSSYKDTRKPWKTSVKTARLLTKIWTCEVLNTRWNYTYLQSSLPCNVNEQINENKGLCLNSAAGAFEFWYTEAVPIFHHTLQLPYSGEWGGKIKQTANAHSLAAVEVGCGVQCCPMRKGHYNCTWLLMDYLHHQWSHISIGI